jgi:arylsulfatase
VADRPNILFFHVDNLGAGELSCYSGGPFRGLTTERIDAFAREGFRLTNYAPEAQCC